MTVNLKASSFAKVTPPTLSNCSYRERLFKLLDSTRRFSVIWVAGPAGCGKTTLVRSYIEYLDLPCLWYQIDAVVLLRDVVEVPGVTVEPRPNEDPVDRLHVGIQTAVAAVDVDAGMVAQGGDQAVGFEDVIAEALPDHARVLPHVVQRQTPESEEMLPFDVLVESDPQRRFAANRLERALPLEDFFIDIFETALEEGELLIEIQVPISPKKTAVAYEKFNIIKNHQGIVSVAASMTMAGDGVGCEDARIVLGAAAATPLRAKEAEQMLIGRKIDIRLLADVGEKVSEECDSVSDIHATETYRRFLIKALTIKITKRAWEQAKAAG